MRIEIEIPKEFEGHFEQDRFEDSLHRLCADAHLIAGNYEKETAIMLIKAFKNSKPAYDEKNVVEQLEKELALADEEKRRCVCENPLQFDEVKGYARGIDYAINVICGEKI